VAMDLAPHFWIEVLVTMLSTLFCVLGLARESLINGSLGVCASGPVPMGGGGERRCSAIRG